MSKFFQAILNFFKNLFTKKQVQAQPQAAQPQNPPTSVQTTSQSPALPQGVINAGGLNIVADAPINPSWKPSLTATIFGQGGRFLFDPSNGGRLKPPQPTRSPAGYPLFYPVDGNGAAAGPPTVVYEDHNFVDDAAVEAFKAKVAQAAIDQAAADQKAANQVFTGPVSATALSKEDLMYLNYKMHQPGFINWPEKVLNGTHPQVMQAINNANDLSPEMRTFVPSSYTGPLKGL